MGCRPWDARNPAVGWMDVMNFSASSRDQRPVINLPPALDRLGGDVSLLRDMAEFYLQDIPPLLSDLKRGLREKDFELIVLSAHSIKGLSRNFDAVHADQSAQAIENSGRAEDFDAAAAEFPRLEEQIDRVIDALKTHVLLS